MRLRLFLNFLLILVDDHARLFETVGAMQVNFNTLFTKGTTLLYYMKPVSVSNNEQILSEINENLRKQNDTLEKQNKNVLVLKKDMKAMSNETLSHFKLVFQRKKLFFC